MPNDILNDTINKGIMKMSNITQLINETKKNLRKYNYDEVLNLCNEILEIDMNSWFGLQFKALSLYRKNEYHKSLEIYERLNNLYPNDEEILYSLMLINEILGDYKTAQEYSRKLLKLKDCCEYYVKYKHISCKLKDTDELINKLNKDIISLEEDKATDKQIKRIIVLYEEKAVYEYLKEDYEKSLLDFKNALEYYSKIKNSTGYHEDKIDNWFELLKKSINEDNKAKEILYNLFNLNENTKIWYEKLDSMSFFSQFASPLTYTYLLLDKYPENMDILKITAKLARYDDYEYAVQCYNKILELDPENENAINSLLNIYPLHYLKDESLKLIDSKLYIEDLKEDLMIKKIELLESMTLYDEALETYDEYISIEKKDGWINHKKTIFDKIRCMEKQATDYYLEGQYNESFKIFKQVNKLFNNIDRNSINIRGDEWIIEQWYTDVLNYAINNSNNDADIFFDEFYTVTNETIDLWIKKIDFLTAWNHYGNPITTCNILLNKNPDNIQIKLAKANVFYRTKRISHALDCYDDILKQDSTNMKALNRKFNLLVRYHKFKKAYELLKTIQIDYKDIQSDLEDLAGVLFNYRKYEESLYCYNIIMDHNQSIPIMKNVKIIWHKLDDKESQNKCKLYLDWIDVIQYKHKTNKCPTCGGQLTPITYGYPPINYDEDVYLGGCCISDDSPTDYCRKCKKEINMGIYGIVISTQDYSSYSYARNNIIWLTKYLERYPKKTIKQLQKESYKMFGLDDVEFTKFIDKLREIEYLTMDGNHIKIIEGYDDFHTLFV
jgi:tetratricopeptide (TPR) repeat protein